MPPGTIEEGTGLDRLQALVSAGSRAFPCGRTSRKEAFDALKEAAEVGRRFAEERPDASREADRQGAGLSPGSLRHRIGGSGDPIRCFVLNGSLKGDKGRGGRGVHRPATPPREGRMPASERRRPRRNQRACSMAALGMCRRMRVMSDDGLRHREAIWVRHGALPILRVRRGVPRCRRRGAATRTDGCAVRVDARPLPGRRAVRGQLRRYRRHRAGDGQGCRDRRCSGRTLLRRTPVRPVARPGGSSPCRRWAAVCLGSLFAVRDDVRQIIPGRSSWRTAPRPRPAAARVNACSGWRARRGPRRVRL